MAGMHCHFPRALCTSGLSSELCCQPLWRELLVKQNSCTDVYLTAATQRHTLRAHPTPSNSLLPWPLPSPLPGPAPSCPQWVSCRASSTSS